MEEIKGIVDRIEGEWVVVEIEGETKDYPKRLFPKEVKTGDVVIIGERITIDERETKQKSSSVKSLMDELWED